MFSRRACLFGSREQQVSAAAARGQRWDGPDAGILHGVAQPREEPGRVAEALAQDGGARAGTLFRLHIRLAHRGHVRIACVLSTVKTYACSSSARHC